MNTMMDLRLRSPTWRYAASLLLGLLIGWWLWHPRPAPVQTARPAVQLPSGGLVLERQPSAPVPAAVKKATKEAGGKLERAVSVVVVPRPVFFPPPATATEPAPEPTCTCAPVHVDLGLVRLPDATQRVVATSQDGDVLGGMDIPTLMGLRVQRQLKWAAGVSVEAIVSNADRHYGAWVERDAGPFRFGAEVQADGRGKSAAAWGRVGIRF